MCNHYNSYYIFPPRAVISRSGSPATADKPRSKIKMNSLDSFGTASSSSTLVLSGFDVPFKDHGGKGMHEERHTKSLNVPCPDVPSIAHICKKIVLYEMSSLGIEPSQEACRIFSTLQNRDNIDREDRRRAGGLYPSGCTKKQPVSWRAHKASRKKYPRSRYRNPIESPKWHYFRNEARRQEGT